MKKWVILFLLIIPLTYGLFDDVIYDDWVRSDEPFIVNNQTYKAIYIKQTNSTVVYFPDGISTLISPSNKSCSKEWIYSVCQSGQKFEKKGSEVIPSINDLNINVSLKLQINSSKTELTYSKDIDDVNYVGDKILVKTLIEKKGTSSFYDITNISYVESFSEKYNFQIVSGCSEKNHKIVWETKTMGSKHECLFYITPLKEQNFTNIVVLSYDVFGKKQIENISKKIQTIGLPFHYTINYDGKNKEIGTLSNFSITISPLSDFTLNNISFILPNSFFLLNNNEENIKMNKSSPKKFYYLLNNSDSGNFSIEIKIKYIYGNSENYVKEKVNFEYYNKLFDISLFDRNNLSIIRLNNPTNNVYSNIILNIGNKSYNVGYLGQNKFYEVEIEEVNNTLIDLIYTTKYGQNKKEHFSLEKKQEPIINDIQKTSKASLNINIPIEYFLILLGVLLFSFILFKSFSMFNKKKSTLDKEIELIRKKKL